MRGHGRSPGQLARRPARRRDRVPNPGPGARYGPDQGRRLSLRITSGRFRGRNLEAPKGARATRPTLSRLRQALFNSLQDMIDGARVLDLFAGSGALGLEALSRGAAQAVFVEKDARALAAIRSNIRLLGLGPGEAEVIAEPVDRALSRLEGGPLFDLAVIDPPYDGGWEEKLLQEVPWPRLLREGGRLCLEFGLHERRKRSGGGELLPVPAPFLVKVREKFYGDTGLATYELRNA